MRAIIIGVLVLSTGCLAAVSSDPRGSIPDPGDSPVTPLPPAPSPTGDTAPAPVPTPDAIFGADLALWLDARTSSSITLDSGGHVTRWADRSKHQHDARVDGWSPSSIVPAFVDDRATVHFAWPYGPSGVGLRAPSLGLVATDATVIVIAALSSAPRNPVFDDNGPILLLEGTIYTPSRGLALYGASATTSPRARVGETWLSTVRAAWNDDHLHAFTMIRAGTTMTVRVDADSRTAPGSGYMTPYSGWQDGTWIGGFLVSCAEGCSHGVYDRLEGDIAEVIVAHTSPSQAAIAALEVYIGARYGLPF